MEIGNRYSNQADLCVIHMNVGVSFQCTFFLWYIILKIIETKMISIGKSGFNSRDVNIHVDICNLNWFELVPL